MSVNKTFQLGHVLCCCLYMLKCLAVKKKKKENETEKHSLGDFYQVPAETLHTEANADTDVEGINRSQEFR